MISQPRMSLSVVIPCYRCASTIERAVKSVLAQTRLPDELILVDDANDNLTSELLINISKTYTSNVNIRLIVLLNNIGAAGARNIGWNAATSELVAFLDSDDSWHPKKNEIQLDLFLNDSKLLICGTRHLVAPSVWEDVLVSTSFKNEDISFASLLWSNRFVTSSVILKRTLPLRFDDGQRFMEDHSLWLKAASVGCRIVRVNYPLTAQHKPAFGASGLSSSLVNMEIAELINYHFLFRSGAIKFSLYLLLLLWSGAKFVRRCIIVASRNIVNSLGS